MSDSKNLTKGLGVLNLGRVSTAVVGAVIVFLIALAVNYIFGIIGGRADLTENNIYTLSEGTRQILKRLDTPVVIRYYVTDDGDTLSPAEQSYSRRVEDLLNEYRKLAGGKLQVKKLNPEPNTDAEDSAILDGLQRGMSRETGNEIFLGISVECIDEKEVLPFLPARPETLLEYDLSRAVARVHDGAGKKVRIMTTMQIGGGFSGNFNAPPQPGWFFVDELRKDYDVEFLPVTAEEIPADTGVLIVLHPYDATEETQYAIDQYLLKGGSVMAVVDPSFFAARFMTPPQQNPMMPQPGMGPEPSSDLGKLFGAWGVKYDGGKVLADMTFQTQIREGYSPTVLSLSQNAMNREDPVTMRLNDIFMIMAGAFEVEAKEGITSEVLVQSSPANQMVSSFDADPTQKANIERLRDEFKPSGESRALVMRLSGSFSTAFPDGNPSAGGDSEDEEKDSADADKKEDGEKKEGEGDEKKEEAVSLKKSEKDGVVILFADADFLYDEFCVQRQNILGQNFAIPINGNLSLMQNALEMLSGDPELIKVRSRASNRRPFTKLNEWLQQAEAKYRDRLKEFEDKAKETESNINKLLSAQPENVEQAMMSPEVQKELGNLRQHQVELNRTVRTLNKEMKKEFDLAQLLIKLLTTGLVPVLVIITGITLAVMRRMRTAAR